jgi:hypothetical protein
MLIKNKAQCKRCKYIIESKHRRDFVTCKCGSISIVGGLDYRREIGDLHNFEDLSEYKLLEGETNAN